MSLDSNLGVVGFTAGVFDLFHVGHLNLLERARERCDYLRVGVLSDELCQIVKEKTPVIPLDERMRILAALRCVDEVVAVNEERLSSKIEAYYKWGFDVVFSGDDHADSEFWQRDQRVLAELGVRVEYLPYTDTVSTSAIRERVANAASRPH